MEWRLDKFLTQIPVGTRSQVKDMIKKGRVCVNGVHASKPELKVDPENDSKICTEHFVRKLPLTYCQAGFLTYRLRKNSAK